MLSHPITVVWYSEALLCVALKIWMIMVEMFYISKVPYLSAQQSCVRKVWERKITFLIIERERKVNLCCANKVFYQSFISAGINFVCWKWCVCKTNHTFQVIISSNAESTERCDVIFYWGWNPIFIMHFVIFLYPWIGERKTEP